MSIFITSAALGALFGIFAGLVPGIGVFAVVAVLYPLILDWPPAAVILFYFALISSSQYFGSITAIYLGIGGESSSFPAVIEGYSLSSMGRGPEALWLTGAGSFVGTMAGLGFLLAASLFGQSFVMTTVQTLLVFGIVTAALFLLSKNAWWINLLMIATAIALSHIGVSANDSIPLTAFGQSWLSSGINYFPLAAGLICMKELFEVRNHAASHTVTQQNYSMYLSWWQTKWSVVRGCVVGSIGGLVPGITTVASSNMAYSAEKWWYRKTYTKGHMPSLVSSETANNTGSVTQLAPLLMFGIPITGSETIIYNILDSKGWAGTAGAPWHLFLEYWWILLLVNVAALILAVKFARSLIKVIPADPTYLKVCVFTLLATSVYWIGQTQASTGLLDLALFAVAIAMALFTPGVNWLPFVFCMVIGDLWLEQVYRIFQLYF